MRELLLSVTGAQNKLDWESRLGLHNDVDKVVQHKTQPTVKWRQLRGKSPRIKYCLCRKRARARIHIYTHSIRKIMAWLPCDPFVKRSRTSIPKLFGRSCRYGYTPLIAAHDSYKIIFPLSISPANYHSWPTFNDLISVAISARPRIIRTRSPAFGFCTITQIAELFLERGSSDFTVTYVYSPRSPLSSPHFTILNRPNRSRRSVTLICRGYHPVAIAFTIFYRRPQIELEPNRDTRTSILSSFSKGFSGRRLAEICT